MEIKNIAAIVIFTALAVVLNLSPLKFPAPYAPFLIYQIWEIPIVIVFLLYKARVGVVVALINTLALFIFFPGALITGPAYNLAAVLSMLLGMGIARSLLEGHFPKNEGVLAAAATGFGIGLRAFVMGLVNYAFLRFPSPVGYSLPDPVIIAYIPLILMFNVTLALYTIPLGYTVARVLRTNLNVFN